MLDPSRNDRSKLQAIENYFTIVTSQDALEVNALYGPIDLIRAIRDNHPKVEAFVTKRLPQMISLAQRKVDTLAGFREWKDVNTSIKSEQSKIGRFGSLG